MKFYSRHKSPSFVMFQGGHSVIETAHGKIPKAIKPGVIRFEPLAVETMQIDGRQVAVPTRVGDGSRLRSGVVKGTLRSSDADRQLRRSGHVVKDGKGVDITEQEAMRFLTSHPRYGIDFISLDDAGVESELADLWLSEIGDGQVHCELCDKAFSGMGRARAHVEQSKEHAALVEQRNAEGLSASVAMASAVV